MAHRPAAERTKQFQKLLSIALGRLSSRMAVYMDSGLSNVVVAASPVDGSSTNTSPKRRREG
uniref:Uncharacterized protein n=1 Tax=Leersia perrieri TaxID=77586 RepID=A0A0D9W1X5_9ORYZ